MWTRAELKERGRKVFMGNYWTTVGCILAILAISAGASGLVSKIAPMGSLIVSILVAYPLTVSMSKFLLDNAAGKRRRPGDQIRCIRSVNNCVIPPLREKPNDMAGFGTGIHLLSTGLSPAQDGTGCDFVPPGNG